MAARTQNAKSDLPTKRLSRQESFDLLILFQSDPTNREVEDRLFGACLEEIKRLVRAYVYKGRMPDLVTDEAVSLAQAKLARSLHKVKSPKALEKWLIKVSRNAVIDEFLKNIIGRGECERKKVPLQAENPEGKLTETLDLRANQEAAERHKSMMGSGAYVDFPENVETRCLLCKLLDIHAQSGKKRDRDSAFWLQTMLVDGISKGEPIDEIAKARGTTRDDVLHLLNHDSRALHRIYRKLRGLT